MAETDIVPISTSANLPVIAADPGEIARITDTIDISDRAGISVYGDNAQQAVSNYADKILTGIRNKDIGDTGKLLTEIILKSKSLDPASLREQARPSIPPIR